MEPSDDPQQLQDMSLEQLVRHQAAIIARLTAADEAKTQQPGDKLASIDINDVKVPYVYRPFPTTVYRQSKKARVDHPGNESKLVHDAASLDRLLKAGWQRTPHAAPVVDEDTEQALVPAKAAGRK